jgi:hypothetical protein
MNGLSEFIAFARYAQVRPGENRRESWEEISRRVMDMHRTKYADVLEPNPELQAMLDDVERAMVEKRILGSQRAAQFAGPAILNNEMRIFNCTATYMNREEAFSQVMWLLLCGCGVGISVQMHHVDLLPDIAAPDPMRRKDYKINDSIEGMADALGVLMASYFTGSDYLAEYAGYTIVFDFSGIRPRGSHVSNMGPVAPGHQPLMAALTAIKEVLEARTAASNRLRPIDVFDIIMHAADSVIAGGIRRSAVLTMFSFEDKEMMTAKTGSWFIDNPQRGRSNNSVVLLRDKTTDAEFKSIMASTKEMGEPGIIWTNDTETLFNPCVPDDTWVMTDAGAVQVRDLIGTPFNALVDGKPYPSKGFFQTGVKPLMRMKTTSGHDLRTTPNHKIFARKAEAKELKWIEMGDLRPGDSVRLHNHQEANSPDYIKGLKYGNTCARCNYRQCIVHCESPDYQKGFMHAFLQRSTVIDDICFIPTGYRVGYDLVQVMSRWGLTAVQTADGVEVHNYISAAPEAVIESITVDAVEPVYDCTVEEAHCFDANGVMVHNCVEIGLYAHLEHEGKRQSGVQGCNLSEINMKAVNTPNDFFEACRLAAIIGTLQAGYTKFPYLGEVSEKIFQNEALIGVSGTGFADSPEIAFNPDIQERGAAIVKETNERVAAMIGIHPAARCTTVKPAGSTSCIVESASGIHPYHSKQFFRRVQINCDDPAVKEYERVNPNEVSKSVWSASGRDKVITFRCVAKEGAITKDALSAIDLLKRVRSTQKHWVVPGTNPERCVIPRLTHNVSNTITVKPHEWDDVASFIYENREYYAGISLLAASGDKDYPQAPFQEVLTPAEQVEKYGMGQPLASGLIVHALQAFGDLYAACATLLGNGQKLMVPDLNKLAEMDNPGAIDAVTGTIEKVKWVQRAHKFSKRYFDSDLKKMTECLKDVDAWKTWCDIERTHTDINWATVHEGAEVTAPQALSACSGGSCELISI